MDITEQFATAARSMQSESDVRQTLDKAVRLAVELVEGCDEACVSLIHRNRIIDTPAATSEGVRRGDALQYELGEGPCLDAIWHHVTVSSPDLANDARWPAWGPRAVSELGVRSMLCFHLFTAENTLGALNLYSRRVNGFDDEDEAEGLSLAAHVAVALAAAQEISNLNIAVVSRTIIGQAEGILMERFGLHPVQAFAVLRRVSQDSNMKLHDVASELVSSRKFPGT